MFATPPRETFLPGAPMVALGLVTVLFLQESPLRKTFSEAPATGAPGASQQPGPSAPAPPAMATSAHGKSDVLV